MTTEPQRFCWSQWLQSTCGDAVLLGFWLWFCLVVDVLKLLLLLDQRCQLLLGQDDGDGPVHRGLT